MGEATADAAAVKVDDALVSMERKDDALILATSPAEALSDRCRQVTWTCSGHVGQVGKLPQNGLWFN